MIVKFLLLCCLGLAALLGFTGLQLSSARTTLANNIAATAQAALAAQQRAITETQKLKAQHAQALQVASARAEQNQLAAGRAAAELGRLRSAIAARGRVPSSPASPSPDNTRPEGELLGRCSAELVELARAADGHASDAVTCRDAWPTVEKRGVE